MRFVAGRGAMAELLLARALQRSSIGKTLQTVDAAAVLPKWGYRGVSGRYSWALISREAPSGVMMV